MKRSAAYPKAFGRAVYKYHKFFLEAWLHTGIVINIIYTKKFLIAWYLHQASAPQAKNQPGVQATLDVDSAVLSSEVCVARPF